MSTLASRVKYLSLISAYDGLYTALLMAPERRPRSRFGCISMTTVEDPESLSPSAQMWLASELLAFEVFPFHAKTGELIRTWVVSVCAEYDLDHLNVAGVCPECAADGQYSRAVLWVML